jgi:hypothetical protein
MLTKGQTAQALEILGHPDNLRAERVFRVPAAALEALVVPPAPKRKAKKRRAPKRATR